ncbi:MAG: DUF1156 domain-containing protein, partial [Pyrinomonadaceae bacterium]
GLRWRRDAAGRIEAETVEVAYADGCTRRVFAHKDRAAWEALLGGLIDAGWTVTASWPIDTERSARWRANAAAALSSSVHLVCRPREGAHNSDRAGDVGDWGEVLRELPRRIRGWTPRLLAEGIVGADAVFACAGPALEIFTRYGRVEKACGARVAPGEYMGHVWAAVAKEALHVVSGASVESRFEPDARLTATWLWALRAKADGLREAAGAFAPDANQRESRGRAHRPKGFFLAGDDARKIARDLSVRLEEMSTLVEIKNGRARLL